MEKRYAGIEEKQYILERFQGKECFIYNLNLSFDQDRHNLIMKLHMKTTELEAILIMYNVSNIKMNLIHSEFSIEGFEIIDNSSNGWSKEVRYCLNDFESGALKLYFERYEILPRLND